MQERGPLRITLDACVIFPVVACDTLLTFATQSFFEPVWSTEITNEVLKTTRATIGASKLEGVSRRLARMNEFFRDSRVEAPIELVEELKLYIPDLQDAHVIATAIISNSEIIATENIKDFPLAVLAALGIRVLTIDQVLCELLRKDRKRALECLQLMAERKENPKVSVLELLLQLERISPNFNKEVRGYL